MIYRDINKIFSTENHMPVGSMAIYGNNSIDKESIL